MPANAQPASADDPRRASIAVALAPVLVLVAFTLVIAGAIGVGTAFGVFVVCTAWIVYEMHRYLQRIDRQADLDMPAGVLHDGRLPG